MKIIRNLTLLAMLLLPLGARADVVNVSSPGNFAVKTLHSNSAVVYCYSLTNGNTYILQNDVSMDAHIHIPSEATVTIDLNNHKLSRGLASPYGWGFVIYNDGGNLTITDSSNEKGGIITGGYNNGDGSGIYNNSGTLTIEGGTFSGNHAASNGGAIYIKTGTLNLKGGTITNNIANNQGAGIYVESDGTMNMQGAPIITGNRVGGSYNNLFLSNNVVINIDAGGLTGSVGSIGVTKDSPGLITTALDNATRYQIFVSDKNNCETTNVVDNTENKAYYQTCWMGLANQMNAGGSISLDAAKVYEAYSTDPCLTVPSGKTVDLDLNGLTLNRSKSSAEADGCAIKVESGGTLTILGSGTIKGGKNSSGGGGIQNLGTLTISGGTIRENTSTSWGGGIHNEGILNISGGIIEQNTASGCNGGGIHNTGTLNITGGTIQSNTATGKGAGIYHDGTAFKLEGAPTISSNKVSNKASNVYLTANHHTITITGAIGEITPISLNMETLGVFTSGLSGKGTSAKFSSEAGNSVKLTDNGSNEAELITYWNYLNRQIQTNGTYTLESGKVYEAGNSDGYLHVESEKTVTINMNGCTLNRNLSSATDNGCVIYNQGTLTINGSGIIRGGNNSDATSIKGGGICNTGTLTITGGTISNNTTAQYGGGIYNSGTLTITGGTNNSNGNITANGIYHEGTQLNLEGNPNINVYLATGKTIKISNTLSNTNPINIATADDYLIFTSGLNGNGDASKFTTNQTGKGIGLNSAGEAILGTSYAITRVNDATGTTTNLFIKGDHYNNMTAVYGERVKVQITTSGVPMSLNYPGAPPSYPKAGVDYEFDMPDEAVTVTAKCRPGGYCGTGDEDIKWAVDNGTLTFITKEETADYTMKSYAAGQIPWVDKTYTSVSIPKQLVAISDYAFCDKNQNLTTFTVEAGNTAFKVVDGLLYSHDGYTLYCYPSGKTNATTYTLPSEVTTVKDGAFAFNITLQNIAVAGGTNYKAADGVLYNYAGTSLICYPAGKTETSYTIVATVAEIKPYAFQSCVALQDVYVLRESSVPTGGVAMFDGTDCRIMVIASLVNSYKAATYWKNYEGRITAIDMTSVTITLSSDADDYDYMGSPVRPAVTEVKRIFDNYILKSGVDYSPISESSYTNNTYLGTGTITINGLGNYAGLTATKDYDITKRVIITGATGNYSTYYHNETVTLDKPSGLAVYTITSVDWETGNTTLSDPLGSIPPNTPVLLYKNGNCNGTYHLKVVTASSASPSPDFKGVTADTPYNTLMSDNKAIYVIKGGQFYRATSGTLKANHCYLAMPNSSSYPLLSRMMVGGGDGDATGIDVPIVEEEDGSDWYSLDGRKLQKRPVQKGVYISNGKKVVIK